MIDVLLRAPLGDRASMAVIEHAARREARAVNALPCDGCTARIITWKRSLKMRLVCVFALPNSFTNTMWSL
jgi:hypothetical protein